jgi:hypothetical protein
MRRIINFYFDRYLIKFCSADNMARLGCPQSTAGLGTLMIEGVLLNISMNTNQLVRLSKEDLKLCQTAKRVGNITVR